MDCESITSIINFPFILKIIGGFIVFGLIYDEIGVWYSKRYLQDYHRDDE